MQSQFCGQIYHNRGTHGDSSLILYRLLYLSEKPPPLSVSVGGGSMSPSEKLKIHILTVERRGFNCQLSIKKPIIILYQKQSHSNSCSEILWLNYFYLHICLITKVQKLLCKADSICLFALSGHHVFHALLFCRVQEP